MRLDEADKSLINQQARLDGLLADRAAGKHVSDYAISAIREEIAKQKRFLAKREVRRQAEREAFRSLPEEARERILAERRREEAESASVWAAFHAEQSADGESVMDREYEQAKSYLERVDAPSAVATVDIADLRTHCVLLGPEPEGCGCYGALGPMDRCRMVPREGERFATDLSEIRLWKCLFRLLDCFARLGSDRTHDRR